MPGERHVKMPCGKPAYCGRANCRHATLCAGRTAAAAPAPPQGAKRELAHPADVVFLYDGSLPGFYCCVHECVYSGQLPAGIYKESEAQPSLFETRPVETDPEKAGRVEASIPKKISREAKQLTETVFLSCLAQKEVAMLRFLLLGYREGARVTQLFGHPDVKPVLDAAKHLGGEAHLLTGFVRFSDYDGVLAATITPKNFILPFLAKHFAARFSGERFLIYDKTHKAALIYEKRQTQIVPMENIDFPQASEEEQGYRALWRQFYRTIAIEARENPRCRMSNMPKRYWENMTEMQEYL